MAGGLANVRFVGRGQELRALAAAYAEAEGASLVVGGDAGGGQDPAAGRVHRRLDAMVLRGGCLPLGATGMPFSPIVEVLRG